jgi:hypothetical protein
LAAPFLAALLGLNFEFAPNQLHRQQAQLGGLLRL